MRSLFFLLAAAILIGTACQKSQNQTDMKAPVADKDPKELRIHDHTRIDEYIWARERKNQKVIEKHFDYSGSGKQAIGYLIIQENNERIIKGPSKGLEEAAKKYKRGSPIKLIHHCTPWRGLNVLLRAMQEIENPNIKLDVYSSCKVYGSEFEKNTEKDFEALYEQARKLPNVNYIGYKPNEYIREVMPSYDMFV